MDTKDIKPKEDKDKVTLQHVLDVFFQESATLKPLFQAVYNRYPNHLQTMIENAMIKLHQQQTMVTLIPFIEQCLHEPDGILVVARMYHELNQAGLAEKLSSLVTHQHYQALCPIILVLNQRGILNDTSFSSLLKINLITPLQKSLLTLNKAGYLNEETFVTLINHQQLYWLPMVLNELYSLRRLNRQTLKLTLEHSNPSQLFNGLTNLSQKNLIQGQELLEVLASHKPLETAAKSTSLSQSNTRFFCLNEHRHFDPSAYSAPKVQ